MKKSKFNKKLYKKYPWYDSYFLLELVQKWLDHSSKMHKERGNLVRSERTAKDMMIASALIKRINKDEYDASNKVFKCRNDYIESCLGNKAFEYNPKSEDLKKQDVEYLFDFMKKHVLNWWD